MQQMAKSASANPYRNRECLNPHGRARSGSLCDGVNAAHYALIDDQIESASGREKAELQTALVERLDQITALEQKLRKASEQAKSSLAELTKAQKRIACQSENIDTLQQQLSAERVSYNDKINSVCNPILI